MTLADDVNLEEFIMSKDEFSGADIKAICTEAGLLALRERRMKARQLCTPNTPFCFSINLLLWLILLVPEAVTFFWYL
jgi:SpoVK/Ycf46/Vps4 family AAA+-type ATPase